MSIPNFTTSMVSYNMNLVSGQPVCRWRMYRGPPASHIDFAHSLAEIRFTTPPRLTFTRSTKTMWIDPSCIRTRCACARVSMLCARVSMLMPDPRSSPLECTTSSGDDRNRLTRNGHARSCSKMVPRARTNGRRGHAPSIWRPLGPADSRLNRRRGPSRHPCRSRTCGGAPP